MKNPRAVEVFEIANGNLELRAVRFVDIPKIDPQSLVEAKMKLTPQ